MCESLGHELFVFNAVKILNHTSALEYLESSLDVVNNASTILHVHAEVATPTQTACLARRSVGEASMELGSLLVQRYQSNRAHPWIPQPNVYDAMVKKAHFAKVSEVATIDVNDVLDLTMVDTLSPKTPAREYVHLFFSNITKWGDLSQNWFL